METCPCCTALTPLETSLRDLGGAFFTDPDGDTLTYTATGFPPGIACSTSGIFSGTLTTAVTYNSSITANDWKGGTVTAFTLWRVLP